MFKSDDDEGYNDDKFYKISEKANNDILINENFEIIKKDGDRYIDIWKICEQVGEGSFSKTKKFLNTSQSQTCA